MPPVVRSGYVSGVRSLLILMMLSATGAADVPYKLVEDAALGTTLPTDRRLLDDSRADAALTKCITGTPPTGSAVYWVDVSVDRIGYTSNRAQDIAASFDARSAAIAACSPKRGAKAEPAEALAWIDGKKATFQSGNRTYDRCMAKALDAIKLPAADSAPWMHVAIMKPAEPLAPRTAKAGLSKADALRDATR
jgi:hypothetical protein